MSSGADVPLVLTPEEQERIAADVAEMRREVDEWIAWLRSPEGKVWVDQQMHEATAIVEKFKQECAAGKYALSPAELERLRLDGVLRKCHTRKSGGEPDD